MTTEANFRDHVRGRWPGWVEGREPRSAGSRSGWGSGNGAPDTELGVPLEVLMTERGSPGGPEHSRYLLPQRRPVIPLPVELKLAHVTHGTKLVASNGIRESQRKWHVNAHVKGVLTAFMWGVPTASPEMALPGWKTYLLDANAALRGWCELGDALLLPPGELDAYRAVGDWARGRWAR